MEMPTQTLPAPNQKDGVSKSHFCWNAICSKSLVDWRHHRLSVEPMSFRDHWVTMVFGARMNVQVF